jgi:hypothetical protein
MISLPDLKENNCLIATTYTKQKNKPVLMDLFNSVKGEKLT